MASYCQELMIPCSGGALSGRIQYRNEEPAECGVLLCPPHPLLAGNMDNNVITALADVLSVHLPVLSFNYCGVGKSYKAEPDLPLFEYWNRLDGEGNFLSIITDTKELIQWSRRLFRQCHVLGYSFGSYIALAACPDSALSFTALTPPLQEHDFSGLKQLDCPVLTIMADKDTLLGNSSTTLPSKTVVHKIAESDHFFLGRELEVARLVEAFLMPQS